MSKTSFFDSLKQGITRSYEEGVTMEEAEKLAAKFLDGSIQVGEAIKVADLDRRMKKAGVKAIRSAVYLEAATQGDRKPSDRLLEAVVDSDKVVSDSQESFDIAEVEINYLSNLLDIFRESHIHFRTIARGRFE